MKKTVLILLSALLISNTCSIYASEDLQSNEGITSEEANGTGFNDAHSFNDESGTMYYNPKYINNLVYENGFTYLFNDNSSVGVLKMNIKEANFDNYFLFKAGESKVKYSGGEFDLSKEVISKDRALFVPIRSFLNAMGLSDDQIIYNPNTKTVSVAKDDNFVSNLEKSIKNAENSIFTLMFENSSKQYVVYDDVLYKTGSQDYSSIESYIKNEINKDFNTSDFIASENEGTLSFNFTIGGLSSDYGYNVLTENGKVLLITQMGTPISKDTVKINESDILSDEEVCKMALEENEGGIVSEQKVYKWIDSATGKIKYTVDTTYGTEETGYSTVEFEYLQD